jgi:lantibiotic modifying enzyme
MTRMAEPKPIRPADLVELATAIGRDLCRSALWYDRRCLWLGDEVEPVDGAYLVIHRDCGGSLYGGTAGIGWFLAHLARRTGDAEALRHARGALRHALSWSADHEHPSLYSGRSGVGWALLDGGTVLGDESLALTGLGLLTNAINTAGSRDLPSELIAGRAGVVVGALAGAAAADRAGLNGWPLIEAALEQGRILLAAARRRASGWTWPCEKETVLCGLGHGTSGPALACAELAAASGEAEFVTAATEAARAERAWLAPESGGWPDLREYGSEELAAGNAPPRPPLWCHGSVGIGLARVRAAKLLGDDALVADATVALHLADLAVATLLDSEPGSYAANFSLCHGAAGLIELFTTAATELSDPGWLARMAAVANVGKEHLHAGGAWRCGVAEGGESPGLMLGLAGTGAALLRAADPVAMASPLLLGRLAA